MIRAAGGASYDLFDEEAASSPTPNCSTGFVHESWLTEADIVAPSWEMDRDTPAYDYQLTAGHAADLCEPVTLSDKEAARGNAGGEYDAIAAEDELSPQAENELALLELQSRCSPARNALQPGTSPRAGGFVCLSANGTVRIERGFVKKEDEVWC